MEHKICKKCNLLKELSNFRKRKDNKSGYGNNCKSCESIIIKSYYKNNKKTIKEKRNINRDKNNEYFKKRYLNNKEKMLGYFKKRYNKNKEKALEYQKEYRKLNINKIKKRQKIWYKNNKQRVIDNNRKNEKTRKITDLVYRLKRIIKNNIKNSLNSKNIIKKNRTHEILGCSIKEFKVYLESQFLPWMNWDNYGKYNGTFNHGWDIDHITPTSIAKTEEELLKLNHYSNQQPLCSKVNRDIKRNKLTL